MCEKLIASGWQPILKESHGGLHIEGSVRRVVLLIGQATYLMLSGCYVFALSWGRYLADHLSLNQAPINVFFNILHLRLDLRYYEALDQTGTFLIYIYILYIYDL